MRPVSEQLATPVKYSSLKPQYRCPTRKHPTPQLLPWSETFSRSGEAGSVPQGGGLCSRPGCAGAEIEEYFLERLVGRCYVADQDVIKYLVAYEK